MKKAKGTKSLIGKVVFAITLVTVLFALIFCAVIKQYNKYGNKNFELFRSDIKYFVVGFALLLIIMLFFFVCMAYAASNGTELATPEYFGVDFEKDAKEKEKLKQFKLRNILFKSYITGCVYEEEKLRGNWTKP